MASNPISMMPYGIMGLNVGKAMRGTIHNAAEVNTLSPTGCG